MPFCSLAVKSTADVVRVNQLIGREGGTAPGRGQPPVAMSFAIHKQVHPPTGVDHAVAAYFTHPIGDGGPPNLVVMQANHLTVFAIRRDPSADPSGDAALSAKAVALALQPCRLAVNDPSHTPVQLPPTIQSCTAEYCATHWVRPRPPA